MLFKIKDKKDLSNKILHFNNNIKTNNKITHHAYKSLSRFDYKSNCEEYFKTIKEFI